MKETLPEGMVAQLERIGQALWAIAVGQQDGSLAVLEQAVLAVMREGMPHLLEEVIKHSQTSLRVDFARLRESCPECGRRVRGRDWRSRTVKTVCGVITFERRWYACPHCGHGWSPTDTSLALLPYSRLSAGFQEWVIGRGGRMSFAEAAAEIEELTGLRVAAETVREQTEARGMALEAQAEEAVAQVLRTQEAAEEVETAPGDLVVEVDGVMNRYRSGWHEVKLGLVGGQVEGELRAKSYLAAREPPEEFGKRLLAEAARRGALEIVGWEGPVTGRGLAKLRRVVIVGDGAVWIWNLAAQYFGERIEIVDFYHASEHIWVVAKALYGEGTEKATAWAEARVHALRHEGVESLLRALAEVKAESLEGVEVLRRERAYFRSNAARMAYPDFEAQGLPLGSGAAESAARHLVQLRMKLPGARWSDLGAQAVLNVRCRLISGRPLAA